MTGLLLGRLIFFWWNVACMFQIYSRRETDFKSALGAGKMITILTGLIKGLHVQMYGTRERACIRFRPISTVMFEINSQL